MVEKGTIRTRVWDRLGAEGIARFPFPPHGRITNFDGAGEAADRAMALPELGDVDAVKANPDAPQLPLRRRLLKNGTTVYMAVPRLGEAACFVRLDPAEISDLDAAPTVSHMGNYGRRVGPDALPELDAIVVGSVAVNDRGERVGKGEGYSDLEYGMLREFELVDDGTPTVTTVHDAQVLSGDARPRPPRRPDGRYLYADPDDPNRRGPETVGDLLGGARREPPRGDPGSRPTVAVAGGSRQLFAVSIVIDHYI